MTSVHPTLFYLLIEFTLVLLVISTGFGFILFKKHLQKKKALSQLVDTLTLNAGQRKEELLSQLFPEQSSEKTDAVNTATRDRIFHKETELYRYMLRLLTSEDPKTILELDENIEAFTNAVISSYHTQLESKKSTPDSGGENTLDVDTELSHIRNDLIALNEKNDLLLTKINDLTLNNATKEPKAPQETETGMQTPTSDGNPPDENITTEAENKNETIEEPAQSDKNENVIDISEDDEIAHKAETPNTNTEADKTVSDDEGIEEIPDDLLQQDELSVDDAATDIDALFAEVANENIEKSAAP